MRETVEIRMPEDRPPTAATVWRTEADGRRVLQIRPGEGYGPGTFALQLAGGEPARAGQHAVVELWLRAVEEEGRSSQVGMEVLLRSRERIGGQFVFPLSRPVTTGTEWERIRLQAQLPMDFGPGELLLIVRPLYFAPVTEVADIRLEIVDEKPALPAVRLYPGQEAEAPWRAKAAELIRAHRAGPLAVRVIDRDGRPLPGARVRIAQTRHAYPFGTAVVANRIVDGPFSPYSPEFTPADDRARAAANAVYREKLSSLFNYAVTENDLKWPIWSGPRHWTRPEWTLEALRWLRGRGFRVKGHTLVWASWRMTPEWLRQYEQDPDALQARILEHIADIGAATRDLVDDWDVLNEPMSHRDLIELLGMERVAGWFRQARAVTPGVRLIINDFDIIGNNGSPQRQDGYYAFIRELLDRGAPIDGIGFQSHFWSSRLTPPERMWEIIDRFAGLGLPLYVTEFDMNLPDEAVQAEYTRDFLTAWFAHPATAGFIMWGFWAEAHWFREAGAMFRANWAPKPNAHAYQQLLFEEWRTDVSVAAGEDGVARARPFFGEHTLTVTVPGKEPQKRLLRHRPDAPAELTVVVP